MRIFATSDIHGYRQVIDKLRRIDGKVDLILICGDIGGKPLTGSLQQLSEEQKKDADYLCSVLSEMKTPCRFILGNNDWFEYDSPYYLREPEIICGRKLVPFEFVSITPFNTNREANENKLKYELGKLEADKNTIIVAHTPPLGIGDTLYTWDHCGSLAVRQWIEMVQPLAWFCGHIHESFDAAFLDNTLVCNCAVMDAYRLRGWLIHIDDANTVKIKKVEEKLPTKTDCNSMCFGV